jgi:hypothetical protein
MSKQLKWHSGPPPSIGWWPASVNQDISILRWWDGVRWSRATWHFYDAYQAASVAKHKAPMQKYIEWTHRPASWPKRSRT